VTRAPRAPTNCAVCHCGSCRAAHNRPDARRLESRCSFRLTGSSFLLAHLSLQSKFPFIPRNARCSKPCEVISDNHHPIAKLLPHSACTVWPSRNARKVVDVSQKSC
jgi:hypothetical protein